MPAILLAVQHFHLMSCANLTLRAAGTADSAPPLSESGLPARVPLALCAWREVHTIAC
jgi:hypothetical protein